SETLVKHPDKHALTNAKMAPANLILSPWAGSGFDIDPAGNQAFLPHIRKTTSSQSIICMFLSLRRPPALFPQVGIPTMTKLPPSLGAMAAAFRSFAGSKTKPIPHGLPSCISPNSNDPKCPKG